ncbi:MAG: GTPase Era [Bacteroidota bacterium]
MSESPDDPLANVPGAELLMSGAVPDGHRSGYVALVGAPNVGKSTLLNRLLGTKLSIVSPRPSTTRNRVLGILSETNPPEGRPPHQIVFLDTPGVVRPRYRLHDHMMRDVDRSLSDADVAVVLADATDTRVTHDAEAALERLQTFPNPIFLAVNKVDRLGQSTDALPLVEAYDAVLGEGRIFEEIVPISALNGTGVDTLLRLILDRLPEGPPYYPTDQLSEHPERFFIGEIVREAVFHQFRDEVPYSTQAVVVTFEEREGRKDFIACDIVVERDSQKAILIGKGGAALKRLGQAARTEIEAFLGRGVFLQLYVKTRADWRNKDGHLREYGFGQ